MLRTETRHAASLPLFVGRGDRPPSIASSAGLTVIKLPRFGSIPAHLHVAPAAPVVLAVIDENPAAGGHVTLVHIFKIRRRQQIARRPHDRPQNGVEPGRIVFPTEPIPASRWLQ